MVNIHAQKVYSFMKEVNNETMAKFAASYPVLHATIGPKELVQTPCGWAFAERTMRNADVVGFRWIYVAVTDKGTYEKIN
eukprot:4029111-Alexandrium_andersonii.AAC.1